MTPIKCNLQPVLLAIISLLPIVLLAYLSYQKTVENNVLIAEQDFQIKELALGKLLTQINADASLFIKSKFDQIYFLANSTFPEESLRRAVLNSEVEFLLFYKNQQRLYPPPESKHQLLNEKDTIYRLEPVVSRFLESADKEHWYWLERPNSRSITYCNGTNEPIFLCILISTAELKEHIEQSLHTYLLDSTSSLARLHVLPADLLLMNQNREVVSGNVSPSNQFNVSTQSLSYPLRGWELLLPRDLLNQYFTSSKWGFIFQTVLIILPLMLGWILLVYSYYRFQKNHELAMQEKSDIISTLSHELKTPITNIKLYLDLIFKSDNLVDKQEKHYYQIIDSELDRFDRLISNALVYSQSGTPERLSIKHEIHPDFIIKQLLESFTLKAAENNCTFHTQLAIGQSIKTNAISLSLILSNLVDNALKYAPGGCIQISSKILDNHYYELRVKDSGTGFMSNPSQIITAATPNASKSGFGIGLPTVHKITQLNLGHVTMANHSSGGAEVIVVLSYE